MPGALVLVLAWCLGLSGPQAGDSDTLARDADRAMREGRPAEAVALLLDVTARAPKLPSGWYALGQAYNAIKQDALRSFDDPSGDGSWQRLFAADALMARGELTEAFVLYREALERLPSMVTIHASVARIYEQTGHADWAARERAAAIVSAADCATRTAMCEFRAGRHAAALAAALTQPDAESRYWRARAANELALAAFKQLDALPDSPERRAIRATTARAEDRHADAIVELEAALTLAPGNPALVYDLASARYQARDYEQTIATLSPLSKAHPDDPRILSLVGYSLLQLRRLDEALPILRRLVQRDARDPGARLALGRALVLNGDFAAAIPLIEPALGEDRDGSLHMQLARAYGGVGQKEKADALNRRAQEIQRAAQERSAAAAQRTITPPK